MKVRLLGCSARGREGDLRRCKDFEALDTKLAERIRALEATKETLTERVADLRRTAPSQAAKDFREQWLDEGQDFTDRMLEDAVEELSQGPLEDGEDMKRSGEVQATWVRGTEGLIVLKTSLPETVAYLERAKAVVEHMQS